LALVRASNTTPILVTRFEAKTKEDLKIVSRRDCKTNRAS